MKVDYVLVGQGLAGSILAFHLLERGKKILVINRSDQNTSSMAAAGIYNPITGRKMVKSWLADQLFPYLIKFYRKLEEKIEIEVLQSMPIYRPFVSVAEQNDWMAKSSESSFKSYIEKVIDKDQYLPEVKSPYGGLLLKSAGFVDIPKLLEGCRRYLAHRGIYREEKFDITKMVVLEDRVKYNELEAKKIIFCQGPQGVKNDYFKWLPFRLVKGELILIRIPRPLTIIINRGIFILPIADGLCKVGATFDWKDRSLEATGKAMAELKGKLDNLVDFQYQLVKQIAGIRPATIDRRPFIGIHPKYEPLVIFNGLGTKGISLAPYFSKQLVDFLDQKKGLPKEVDISRFF